jgi:hypothetical protein
MTISDLIKSIAATMKKDQSGPSSVDNGCPSKGMQRAPVNNILALFTSCGVVKNVTL